MTMNPAPDQPDARAAVPVLPKPVIKKMRWPFPIVWIVPLVAAVLAGYYIHEYHKEHGAIISIQFDDASGLVADQTTLQVHGVPVGKVKQIELSDDHIHAIARVRLNEKYNFLAKKNSQFWVVRPQVSLESVTGLNALVSGPYLEATPGDGDETTSFVGMGAPPIITGPGMKVVLHADQLGELALNSPVTYRGIQVGVVQDIRLSDVADSADVTIYIHEPYMVLVRTTSVFWMVKGADIKGGLFTGVKFKLDSLRAILTGGVTFSTPEKNIGKPAPPNSNFFLNDSPKDDWLKWKPKIKIATEANPTLGESQVLQTAIPASKQPGK